MSPSAAPLDEAEMRQAVYFEVAKSKELLYYMDEATDAIMSICQRYAEQKVEAALHTTLENLSTIGSDFVENQARGVILKQLEQIRAAERIDTSVTPAMIHPNVRKTPTDDTSERSNVNKPKESNNV